MSSYSGEDSGHKGVDLRIIASKARVLNFTRIQDLVEAMGIQHSIWTIKKVPIEYSIN